jgi:hypothetical protein
MTFEAARAVADAVLFEGYALYPYRASSPKNQLRWQFGVLAPRGWSEAGGGDPWWQQTECLVGPAAGHPDARVRVEGKLRFLQVLRRERQPGDGAPAWDEGKTREIDFAFELARGEQTSVEVPFEVPGGTSEGQGSVHRCWPVTGVVRVDAAPQPGTRSLIKLRVRVENAADDHGSGSRDEALRGALLGTHLLLAVSGGGFLSLMDPPEWAAPAAAACRNIGTYPVLVGPEGRDDLLLSAPIILSDHPAVAPESPRDLFDATEIDEILSLRILTLTDQEKVEMRATDPRLAKLLDAVERLGPEDMARLHGTRRELHPVEAKREEPPAPTEILVRGVPVAVGSRVKLQPGARRTDAQDMFVRGMTATVQAVMRDVDDQDCLAVTIDDDPAAEVMLWHGRYHYYYPDEVEPLDVAQAQEGPP